MRYLTPYSLGSSPPSTSGGGGSPSAEYGRVTEVILAPQTNPGGSGIKAVNSIRYSPMQNTNIASDEVDKGTEVAYPIGSDFFTIPIVGEVVRVILDIPSPNIDTLTTTPERYYTRIINYWNTPKDGLFYDTSKNIEFSSLHNIINVNPIKTSIGDTIVQGRYGQVMRFTQEQDSGKPRIHLSTGRPFEAPDTNQVELDLHKAQSGIDFITDGLSKLETIKIFQNSHRSSEKPKTSNTYKGEQILVNTGRLVLNSKNDSTLISAKESISLSANTLNQEAGKEICFDAPKIYLGQKALLSSSPEPILLGNQVEQYLIDILGELIRIADSLNTASTTSGDTLPILSAKAGASSVVLKSLIKKLNPIGESTLKSKKSFTE
jgi:hypothetical protein